MIAKIQFDDSCAGTYRKSTEVLAFRSEGPITFHKPWGTQELRGNAWVIVPLSVTGKATGEVYGCDEEAFENTYLQSSSGRDNHYFKTVEIRAYQPGIPFEVDTVLPDGYVEVHGSRMDSHDGWLVRAPDGEIYPIENKEFERTYVEVK